MSKRSPRSSRNSNLSKTLGQLDVPEHAFSATRKGPGSPMAFSPRNQQSSKHCAVSVCNEKRFARGYCAEHQAIARTKKSSRSGGGGEGGGGRGRNPLSATMPLPGNRRKCTYPIKKDDKIFRNVQEAWKMSWTEFVWRLDNLDAPPKNDTRPVSRIVLEVMMSLCEQIHTITSLQQWVYRADGMAGKPAHEVILYWSRIMNDHLNERTVVRNPAALQSLVLCLMSLRKTKESDALRLKTLKFNRNICAQIISALGANHTNCYHMIKAGALSACHTQLRDEIEGDEEDLTVQSLVHFLIECGSVWKVVDAQEYPARDWARQAFQSFNKVLDDDTSAASHPTSVNAKGRALMGVLVRISPHRCHPFHVQHARALFEVPNFLARIVNWFYERHALSESFDDVVSEIVRDLCLICTKLPTFMTKSFQKALKFGQACSHCEKKGPDVPMIACCTCRELYYCSRACQTENWPSHKDSCKRAWQEDVLQPVGYGEEASF